MVRLQNDCIEEKIDESYETLRESNGFSEEYDFPPCKLLACFKTIARINTLAVGQWNVVSSVWEVKSVNYI